MIRVNVYARDLGWLFEDLKGHFARLRIPGIAVAASDAPLDDADAWVVLRAAEAATAPDPARTVVCLHDLYDHPALYAPDGIRGGVHAAGALAFSHPHQRRLLIDAGVKLERKRLLERPLGALSIFTPRAELPEKFCIGWVGRNDWRKRVEWIAEIAARLELDRSGFTILLLGHDLDDVAESVRSLGIECDLVAKEPGMIDEYPALYARMDCLCITSITEAGPLTLFEALATGLPVVSAPVGWAPHFAWREPGYVLLGESPAEIASHLRLLHSRRRELFDARRSIAQLVAGWRLDDWFGQVAELAASLAGWNAGPMHRGSSLEMTGEPCHF